MTYFRDDWLTILEGDCRAVLRDMDPESVHCVVTSPPYFGLRDYGTATWAGGDEGCDHRKVQDAVAAVATSTLGGGKKTTGHQQEGYGVSCARCGATRIDSQLGLEKTPEEYVAALVDVFREVKRVLRHDGTLWLNLGDSYANPGNKRTGEGEPRAKTNLNWGRFKDDYDPLLQENLASQRRVVGKFPGLKPKDLVGIPWRVAFALQADGWYLRSDVIWSKPNPMPESVTDRPTKSHEYLFLLSKSARYWYDADAVREPHLLDRAVPSWPERKAAGADSGNLAVGHNSSHGRGLTHDLGNPAGRNLRSVWTIATAPYPGAHFATFPPKLVEPCIKAGTSQKGVCPQCGAPWVRDVVRGESDFKRLGSRNGSDIGAADTIPRMGRTGRFGNTRNANGTVPSLKAARKDTVGWKPTCKHHNADCQHENIAGPCFVPAVVLDCFAGTGTVGLVAQRLSRRAVLIDLNADYLRQCLARNAQTPLGLETA